MRAFTFAAILGGLLSVAVGRVPAADPSSGPRQEAARILEQALARGKTVAGDAARRELFQRSIEEVLPLLQKNVLVSRELDLVRCRAKKLPDHRAAAALREAIRWAHRDLTFKHVVEALMPQGFPEPKPVGEIHVKHYPEYRVARTDLAAGKDTALMTLIGHIKRKKIPMSMPVEVSCAAGAEKKIKLTTMAFVYGSPEIGQTGKDGAVEVMDLPSVTVVSIGLRGVGGAASMECEEARELLREWLRDHADRYRPAGPFRVMVYNSPLVPRDKRYEEVQIPVDGPRPDERTAER